jgi:2-oxoglutarate ferredoxin oxidoreductase subunit alpha
MSDQFLADMRKNCTGLDTSCRPINRHVIEDAAESYLRYAVTDSGVSPRALPGGEAFVVLDSDEHTEDGHITEDLEARVRLQDKRLRKLDGMKAEALAPTWHGPPEADHVLVCWGSAYGPCREAADRLNEAGRPTAALHFTQVWPLDAEAIRRRLGSRRVTCVEGNATGQFASVLREVGALSDCEMILKYDGMPFTGEEIAERVTS